MVALTLAACGRIGFDPATGTSGDGGTGEGGPIDAATDATLSTCPPALILLGPATVERDVRADLPVALEQFATIAACTAHEMPSSQA